MDTLIQVAEPRIEPVYEADYYAWLLAQAALLRSGRLTELDVEHLVEEMESLAGRERHELQSRLAVLLLHLLKWAHQPDLRGRSWQSSIVEQRTAIETHLDANPSLRPTVEDAVVKAYRRATARAELETGFPRDLFGWSCPFTFEQMMEHGFWPEQMP